jgi:hypothetical protein
MQINLSRRAILQMGLTASVILPSAGLGSLTAVAAGSLTALDPGDPTAQALRYVPDASKVNAAANPTFKPTQKCATCSQFQGKSTDTVGGCNIFPGKSVPAGGWCQVWAAKA